MNGKTNIKHRVITLLDREEMEFLDRLGKDSLFSTNHKLSYNEILKGLIQFAMEIGLRAENVKTMVELKQKLFSMAKPQVILERRKYPRIQKCLQVDVRVLESLAGFETTNTQNLSVEGLCVDLYSSASPPAIGQPLELMIDDKQQAPIKAIGKVAWVKEKEDKQGFSIGVKLTYIRDEDRARFLTYLEETVKLEQPTQGGQK